ncbi:MAG: hypothetical protein ACRD68_14670 [Pyrinomonadaceae bacterium]
MFGLGSIFGDGGIFVKFFDSIGMGWMGNVLSLATNAMTGNWLAAAKDVFDLVSEFSQGGSWMDRVAKQPPLGPFSGDGCFGINNLTSSRFDDIQAQADRGGFEFSSRLRETFRVANDTVASRSLIEHNRQAVYSSSWI